MFQTSIQCHGSRVDAQSETVQGRTPMKESSGLLKISNARVIGNKVPRILVDMQALLKHGAVPSLAMAIHAGYVQIHAGRRTLLGTFEPMRFLHVSDRLNCT